MHLTPEQLTHFQTKLQEEKARLEQELSLLGTKKGEGDYETKMNDMGSDEEETASEVEEYVDNLAVESNLEQQLKEILVALDKVEAGTYGLCEKTGAPIAIERLVAYPSARVAL
jgi:RNA polymerase-binding transcription factor DksA